MWVGSISSQCYPSDQWCHELGMFHTIDFLFSIYRVKNTRVQLYFDKKEVVKNSLMLLVRILGGTRSWLGIRIVN